MRAYTSLKPITENMKEVQVRYLTALIIGRGKGNRENNTWKNGEEIPSVRAILTVSSLIQPSLIH